jgi:hypothetical protein
VKRTNALPGEQLNSFVFWVGNGFLVVLLWALVLTGCSRGDVAEEGPPEETADLRDSLSLLADEVDDAFLQSITATDPADDSHEGAFAAAELLVAEVLVQERPNAGWTQEELDAALGQRRLSVELHSLGTLEVPWLVRIAHPLRPASAGRVLLAYPEEAHLIGLPDEPFQNVFETATWKDSGGAICGIAGWARSRAGLQPTVWVFRVPESSEDDDWLWDTLPIVSRTPLSDGGASSVTFVGADGSRPPRMRVTEAVLPNYLFDECANCPHLQADLTFRYDAGSFRLSSENARRSPYASFVFFVEALLAHDDEAASELVTDRMVIDLARDFAFDRYPRRGRWRIAPGSNGTGLDQIYLRGEEGAYRILMSVSGSSFIVSSISPTEFIID